MLQFAVVALGHIVKFHRDPAGVNLALSSRDIVNVPKLFVVVTLFGLFGGMPLFNIDAGLPNGGTRLIVTIAFVHTCALVSVSVAVTLVQLPIHWLYKLTERKSRRVNLIIFFIFKIHYIQIQ